MRRRACGWAVVVAITIAACLPAPRSSLGADAVYVPVTFYTLSGVTYYGEWTGYGTAACGWGWDEWQELYLPWEDRTVWCSDRIGSPLSAYHVDVWEPDGWDLIAPFGPVQPVIPIYRY